MDNSCFIGEIAGASIPAANSAFVLIDLTNGKLATALVDGGGNRVIPSLPGAQQRAMLNRKVDEQQATIVELKSTIAQQQKAMDLLTAQLKEQGAQIERVSAQLHVNSSAGQVVANNR